MSSSNQGTGDTIPQTFHALVNGLSAMTHKLEPALRGLGQLAAHLEPLTRSLETAAPLIHAVAREITTLDIAEYLLDRRWVPNHTTPYDLVAKCRNDDAKLQMFLLTYYTDNWGEVRTCLEARLSSYSIDDEAKATFREALDAYEAGLYRTISRLLFPEFERLFRAALFDGRAGQIRYNKFLEKLVSNEEADLGLGDFLIAGLQDMVLFKYLTAGVRNPSDSAHDTPGTAPRYVPGLSVGVNKTNVEDAKQSPIPTRHAVAHGLVTYSSPQSSLNAIFIADYVFSIMSRVLPLAPDLTLGDGRNQVPANTPTTPVSPEPSHLTA